MAEEEGDMEDPRPRLHLNPAQSTDPRQKCTKSKKGRRRKEAHCETTLPEHTIFPAWRRGVGPTRLSLPSPPHIPTHSNAAAAIPIRHLAPRSPLSRPLTPFRSRGLSHQGSRSLCLSPFFPPSRADGRKGRRRRRSLITPPPPPHVKQKPPSATCKQGRKNLDVQSKEERKNLR